MVSNASQTCISNMQRYNIVCIVVRTTKKYCASVMIDNGKAFDSIYHSILLRKLHMYGVRGIRLKGIRNYLTDRKQYV